MSPNNHAMKTHSEKWCTFELIVRHGIVDCLLTHMPKQSILNLSPLVELHQKGLKSANVKMMMFVFIVELGFPMMAIIVGYKAQSSPLPWSVKSYTWLTPFAAFWISYSCDLSSLGRSLNYNSLKATQVKML